MRVNTNKIWIQFVRWISSIVAIIASFRFLELSAGHIWAAGFHGPSAEWHKHWGNTFALLGILLLTAACALIWFLRPTPDFYEPNSDT